MKRRLEITVCPLEPGIVVLPVTPAGAAERMNARAIARRLAALVDKRRLARRVSIREGCAGGCASDGPNVSVTIYPVPPPGERPDRVAIGWKTYVYSLATLDCLATVIDENLADGTRRRRGGRPSPPP
ncbi:MAG: hypothetical protein HY727_08365 [Candidatus Rokubacteria bacterium]|nr:hypothetical protein [Candidatus Rokubacteria bacterium]